MLQDSHRPVLAELDPVLRRAADLDPGAVVRLRFEQAEATVLARLPFGVLVSRTVGDPAEHDGVAAYRLDVTVHAGQTVQWLDGDSPDTPANRDADWRGGIPPRGGWRRLDTVPEDVIRGLVRSGSSALKEAADREGVPGAQPRAAVADSLLDSVVLTVDNPAGGVAEVTLRTLSALTRMGFLPQGGSAGIDVAGRWMRVAAGYGSVYAERPGAGLGLA